MTEKPPVPVDPLVDLAGVLCELAEAWREAAQTYHATHAVRGEFRSGTKAIVYGLLQGRSEALDVLAEDISDYLACDISPMDDEFAMDGLVADLRMRRCRAQDPVCEPVRLLVLIPAPI